ncbi:hypothetical protein D3C80_1580430 [compost metagenome]
MLNIEHRGSNTGHAQLVFFAIHRHALLADIRQLLIHLRQFGNGVTRQHLDLLLVGLPIVIRIVALAIGHENFAHRRTVQRHMLADVSAGTHHAGGRLQLVDQDHVIVFPAREVDRFPHFQIQLLQMRGSHVDDVQ